MTFSLQKVATQLTNKAKEVFSQKHQCQNCGTIPGDGGDGVPEHPEHVGEVEDAHALAEGGEELAGDVAHHGEDEDGGVAPVQHRAHDWDNRHLAMETRH